MLTKYSDSTIANLNQCKVNHLLFYMAVHTFSRLSIYFAKTFALNDWNCSLHLCTLSQLNSRRRNFTAGHKKIFCLFKFLPTMQRAKKSFNPFGLAVNKKFWLNKKYWQKLLAKLFFQLWTVFTQYFYCWSATKTFTVAFKILSRHWFIT